MTIAIGAASPTAIFVGTNPASAIYVGSTLVWSAIPAYPTLRARSGAASAGANSLTHPLVNPPGAAIGDLVVFVVGFDWVAGNSVSVSSGSGWAISTFASAASGHALTIAWKVLTGTGDTLTLATATSEQSSFLGWCYSIYSGSPMISAVNAASGVGLAPNSPNLAFGATKNVSVISAGISSQADPIQTAAPAGYGQFRNQNSNTNGSVSIRTFAAERDVNGTSEDPAAWSVTVADPITITIGIQG